MEQPIVPKHKVLTVEQLEQMNDGDKKEFFENIKEQREDLMIHAVMHKIEEGLADTQPQNGVYKVSLFARDLIVEGMQQTQVVAEVVRTYHTAGFQVKTRKWSQHTDELVNAGEHVDFLFSIPKK